MAHEIEVIDGKASFFSHREIPWHKLGTIVQDAPGADDALKLAGLDWEVSLEPTFAKVGDTLVELPEKRTIVRRHPDLPLPDAYDVVSKWYQPVQNRQLAEFMEVLVAESGERVGFETAGSLLGGRRVFMTMQMPRDIVLDKAGAADQVRLFILATTGHTGKESTRLAVTPVRVVCQNTLTAGLNAAQRIWTHTHISADFKGKVQQAREALGVSFEYIDAFEAWASGLYEQSVTDKQFADIVVDMFPVDDSMSQGQVKNANKRAEEVMAIWQGDTQAAIKNTAWGAYNAFVEWSDYYKPMTGDLVDDRRFLANNEGAGAQFKARAQQLVTAAL